MFSKVIRLMEYLLFVVGFACLALFLWSVGEREWFQHVYLSQLSEDREVEVPNPSALYRATELRSGPLGRIEIPRAHLSAAILDGVDTETLDLAVGHVPGTAYPGEANGRVALAAHRDSFFRNLGTLKKGDTIRLETGHRLREYKVESTEVVKPEQTEVLAASREPLLTLITCYPFQYLGSAPDRFIVQARLVENPNAY